MPEKEKIIFCPKCHRGCLDQLTEQERKDLMAREGKDNYPAVIFGCDECRYWCDAEVVDKR